MKTPSVREMIDRLVAVPSISAVDPALDMGNVPVLDELSTWLEDEGWRVERVAVSEGKENLIATRGRGPGGLVLSGHSDTVPYDDGKWSSDPFAVTERDGKLFGLGTSDMKAFLALAVDAARAFDDADLKEPLILLATADEETGMAGAKTLVAQGRPKARRAIIGEPTGLRPIRLHKGAAMERLELTGRSGHSSDPRFGASALDGMHAAMSALIELRERLAEQHRNAELDPPHPTMNFGRIEGGDNPNRICAHCALDYDVRLLPGMALADLRADVHGAVAEAVKGRGLSVAHLALTDGLPPFETPADSALVQACERLTGHTATGVSFGTEAPFLSQLGMETVVLGPGDISVAHQPDEHLPLDRITPTLDLLRALIAESCTA